MWGKKERGFVEQSGLAISACNKGKYTSARTQKRARYLLTEKGKMDLQAKANQTGAVVMIPGD